MSHAIVFEDVRKQFAQRFAVDGLSFVAERGTIYGLLGPNGAGKTTSIRMMMSILRPDSGNIAVLGARPSEALKDRIGYLPEERGLYQGMRVIDNLVFFGALHGLDRSTCGRRAVQWLERLSMADSANAKLQELSKGNQQKIQFIATVLHEPELLVLDEPFSGLDPINQNLLRETILGLRDQGTTVVLSTHLMDEVERLCSHLTLIHNGQAIVDGKLESIRRKWGADTLRIGIAGDGQPLEEHPDVVEASRIGKIYEVRLRPDASPAKFLAEIASRCAVHHFEIVGPSLHNIFIRLVENSTGSAPHPKPEPSELAPTVSA